MLTWKDKYDIACIGYGQLLIFNNNKHSWFRFGVGVMLVIVAILPWPA
jgi:hypothetical protein